MVESKFMTAENGPESAFIADRRQKLEAVLARQQAFIAEAQIFDTSVFNDIPIGTEEIAVGRRRIQRLIFLHGTNVRDAFQTVIKSLLADLGEDRHTGS